MEHYVYRHIRLDKNEPFYIGVGNNIKNSTYKRAFETKRPASKIWNSIVSKSGYDVEIVMEFDNYSEALEKEIELIKIYGRINNKTGTLANMTDGGQGIIGRVTTEESSKRYSEASKKKPRPSEESKLKNRIAHLGKKASEETIAKLKNRKSSAKRMEWLKQYANSPKNLERFAAMRIERIDKPLTKEHRQKISDAQKGRSQPEYLKQKWSIQRSVCPIIQYDLSGNFIKEWISIAQICRELGRPNGASNIARSCNEIPNIKRKRNPRSAYGFKWTYKNKK